MARRKSPEDMSVEELHRLLIENRRGARRDRLEHFKRTGRVVDVAPDILTDPVPVVETPEGEGDQPPAPASEAPAWKGRVRYVSSEAAFTPYYALNERDRSRLSFLAEVDLVEDDAAALPTGMPVEVALELQGGPP